MTEGPYKLPEGWQWVRLGEVAFVRYGKANPKTPGNVPVIGSGGIYDFTESALVSFPTIVIGRKGSAGEAVLMNEPCWPSDTTFYLEWKSQISPAWVFYWLTLRKPSPEGTTATLPSLRREDLESHVIPLPPLEEQKRIVARIEELMGRVREARRLREEAKQEAERLWQAVLAQTFPRPGSELPEGWRWVRLGEITDIQSGGTPKRSVKEYWGGGIPWAKISDIPEDGIVDQTEETITEKGLANSNAKLFPPGTVLFSIFATIGKVGILKITAATNQAIAGVTIRNPGEIESHFLFYCLRWFSSRVVTEGRGMAQNNINLTILRNTLIPLPPLEEQRRIVAYFQEVQEKIKALKEAQAQTEAELKRPEQAILEKAFRGEL